MTKPMLRFQTVVVLSLGAISHVTACGAGSRPGNATVSVTDSAGIERLLVDDRDYLWVEQFRPPWEERPRWWVFNATGRWLGEVQVPLGLRILEIGSDYVLGHRRDENGVEYVSLYTLTRR